MKHEIVCNEEVNMSDSLMVEQESNHLIISNKNVCTKLLSQDDLSQNDIIDLYIALHLVLEISLNSLHRSISLTLLRKNVDRLEVIENVDNIGFIEKTTLFIYNSKFNFQNNDAEAINYHSLIGTLKNFSFIRNRLLHGHSIRTIIDEGDARHSKIKQKMNIEDLKEQISKLRFIFEGMRFYLDNLDLDLSKDQINQLKQLYLNDDFLV